MLIKSIPTPNATGNDNVVAIDIYGINISKSTIYAVALDKDNNELGNCHFCYTGEYKNVPFDLTEDEITIINTPIVPVFIEGE